MGITVAELNVLLNARTEQFERALKDADKRLHNMEKSADRGAKGIGGSMKRMFETAGGFLGGTIITRLGDSIVGMAQSAFDGAVKMEGLTRGMEAVMGSSARAAAEIEKLKETAKLPGLGFHEAIEGSLRLQAAGLQADLARRALEGFGNALGTAGKGKAELDGVTLALSQIASKGKVSAEEINQIAERVPQIRMLMKEAFGTADTEALQKMGIDSQTFITKIVAQLEKLPKVTGGARSSIENFQDSLGRAAASIGNVFLPAVTAALDSLTPLVEDLVPKFEEFGKNVQAAFAGLRIAWEADANGIRTAGENLGNFFNSEMRPMIDQAVTFVQQTFAGLVSYFQEIAPIIQTIWNNVSEWLRANFGNLKAATAQLWAAIQGVITQAVEIVKGVVKSALQLLSGDWKGAWETLIATTKGAAQGIVEIVKNLGGAMWDLGKAIVDGLWRGIKSAWTGFIGSVKGLIEQIPAAAKNLLGIRSPSRVFMEIGQDIMKGFEVGILGGFASLNSTVLDVALKSIQPFLDRKAELEDELAKLTSRKNNPQGAKAADLLGLDPRFYASMGGDARKMLLQLRMKTLAMTGEASKLFNGLGRHLQGGKPFASEAGGSMPQLFNLNFEAIGKAVADWRVEQERLAKVFSDTRIAEVADEIATYTQRMEEARWKGTEWADAMLDGIDRLREEGFAGLLRSFEDTLWQMGQMALRAQIANWFAGIFGGGGGFSDNLIKGSQQFVTAIARADGGPIHPGKPYLVGERGPELIMPAGAGTVIPNGGVGGVNVHITINGIKDEGHLGRTASQIARQAGAAVRDAQRRG